MTLTLVAAHDAVISKPAPVPVPGGLGWLDGELPEGLTGEDVAGISEAMAAGRAGSTRKAYASAWRRFERWCADRAIPPLPATPATVCAYLAEFATQGVAAGTIDGACAAIADAHNRAGLQNPVADETVKAVRRGIRRTLGTAPRRTSRPLSTAEIRLMLAGIDRSSVKGVRDAAVICSGSPRRYVAPSSPTWTWPTSSPNQMDSWSMSDSRRATPRSVDSSSASPAATTPPRTRSLPSTPG